MNLASLNSHVHFNCLLHPVFFLSSLGIQPLSPLPVWCSQVRFSCKIPNWAGVMKNQAVIQATAVYIKCFIIHRVFLFVLNASHGWICHSQNWGISKWNLQNYRTVCVFCENIWRIMITLGPISSKNMLGYLSLDNFCSQSSQLSSNYTLGKTVRFSEQIMKQIVYV